MSSFLCVVDVLESVANKCQEDITCGVSHFRVSGTIIDNDCRIMLCHFLLFTLFFFEKFSNKIRSHLFFQVLILTQKIKNLFCEMSKFIVRQIRIVYC